MTPTWLPQSSSGRMVGDYFSTAYTEGNAVSIFSAAGPPSGSTFDQAMYAATLGPPAPAAPEVSLVPWLSGLAQVGQILRADSGNWSGLLPIAYLYQWQRCAADDSGCEDIVGAIDSSYTISAEDTGSTLRAVVTAANALGQSSAPTLVSSVVGGPTAVTVVSLTARRGSSRAVKLTWRTRSEVQSVGFGVWRSRTRAGSYGRINRSLIPVRAAGAAGARYVFVDRRAPAGRAFYRLELVALDGSRSRTAAVSVR